MMMNTRQFARSVLAASLLTVGLALYASAADLPGKGIKVHPVQSQLAEESFQTLLVVRALEKLGYDVAPIKEVDYPVSYVAVADGSATFMANNWDPHHSEFYKEAGGDAKFTRTGVYSSGAVQGYMIDKKTADQYKITNLGQLTDPKLAKLFDSTGDGKADLVGPSAGWGGEAVVEHQLDTFKLKDTVTYVQGNYPALIADTVARFKAGKPVLYYAWTPYWLSNVVVPGRDAIWLEVPHSAMPGGQAGTDTKLANGKNYGFPLNNQYIVANKEWAAQNPAAAKLFEVMQVPLADISAQNRMLNDGQKSQRDFERHADSWIKAHQKAFDGWIAQATAAAKN